MRRRVLALLSIIVILVCLCSCSGAGANSTFSIHFIDVGQGDAALVECDGHYMLIDGGDVTAGDKVYSVLEERGVQKLDILVVSHLHQDHYGGLIKALTYATKIGVTISNATYSNADQFRRFEHQLGINGSRIKVPSVGKKFKLGSANVEVIDVSAKETNDSLVLLITYGETRFLFTGDIEDSAQKRIYEKYPNGANLEEVPLKVDLIKMPHHGSFSNSLQPFLWTFMPDNVIISVGKDNPYGHPHTQALDKLKNKTWNPNVYRTDIDGDIMVESNGRELLIESTK